MKTITYDDTKYKLVPVKPTPEMAAAGTDDLRLRGYDRALIVAAIECYRSMLSAAPEAQAQPAPVQEQIERAKQIWREDQQRIAELSAEIDKLTTAQPAPVQPVAWMDQTDGAIIKAHVFKDGLPPKGWKPIGFIDAPPAAQPAPVQEPVAWPEHEFIQWGAKKYGPLVQAAINLLAEIDSNHDSKSYPQKYGVPYGAVNTLRDSLTATPPAAPVQDGMVLVPKRMTKAMQEVADTEGWQWEDLLAAAEAITEDEYNEIATSPSAQPAMPLTNEDLDRCRQWFDSIQDTNP